MFKRDIFLGSVRREGKSLLVFLDPSLEELPSLRKEVLSFLKKNSYEEESSYLEILLIIEELLSNAILATMGRRSKEKVVLKLSLYPDEVRIYTMDYGGGFDIEEVFKKIPDGKSIDSFLNYSSWDKDLVPFSAGRGLLLVRELSSSMEIFFHSGNGEISPQYSPYKDIQGSIFVVRYSLKK